MAFFKFSSGRVALGVSMLVLVVTAWQALEAHNANSINKEAIKIELKSSDVPSQRIGAIICLSDKNAVVQTYWRITIFNSSAQPVTIKSLVAYGYSPAGEAIAGDRISMNGPVGKIFPETLAGKGHKSFLLAIPIPVSPQFVQWYSQTGGCGTNIDWLPLARQAGFNEVGWLQVEERADTSGAYVSLDTGDGNQFSTLSSW